MKTIDINKLLKEVTYNFSRSGGKGGQNVNKVETKVELIFNISDSLTLDDESKETLVRRLKNKIDNDGDIRIMSQTERTQLGNRKKTIDKFEKMIELAMKKENVRIKTAKTLSSKLARLEQKRKKSEKKNERRVKEFEID
jgi:ribosome-associated protein